ncbi:MAG: CsbD family protein, partial [Chloroflexi bacterium]
VEGEVKDTGGKVTGDKKMEWEGKGQKAKGKLEEAGRKLTQDDPTITDQPAGSDTGL